MKYIKQTRHSNKCVVNCLLMGGDEFGITEYQVKEAKKNLKVSMFSPLGLITNFPCLKYVDKNILFSDGCKYPMILCLSPPKMISHYILVTGYDKDKKELTCNDPLGCYPYFINQSGDSIKYSLEMLKKFADWGLCKGENDSIDYLDKGYTIGDLSRSIRFALIRHPYARRQLEKKGLLDQYNKVKSLTDSDWSKILKQIYGKA